MKSNGICDLCLGSGIYGNEICPICNGDGAYRDNCERCKGTGMIVGVRTRLFGLLHPVRAAVTCPDCRSGRYKTVRQTMVGK